MQNGRQFWQEIMDEKQLKKILKLTVNERYEYFLERAVDAKMLWALKDSSGWLLFGDNHEKSIMTLWPEKDFAEIYGKGLSLKCKAASISLDIFLDEWVPRFHDDGVKFLVFPTSDGKGVKFDALKLKDAIVKESKRCP
jgi:hypothetical protein